jgi:uncharacterized protein YbjT (DUF2867 family)
MEVLVIGGHGQVGLRLLRLLARNGHRSRGVIRKAEQARDLEAAGAEAVLCDLERGDDLRPHVGAADAIVFAAGAGPGSGPERKRTVDYGAAVKSMEAARDLGVTRFVIVSSIGTHDVAGAAEPMRPYLQAKRDADDVLKQSGLEWTIVKPGHLTDAPPAPVASRSAAGSAAAPTCPATTLPWCCWSACRRRTPSESSSSCSKATSRRARPSAPCS